MKIYNGQELVALRKSLGLSQAVFWSKLGVTQSGGCRYETGREVHEPVQLLLNIVFENLPLSVSELQRIYRQSSARRAKSL